MPGIATCLLQIEGAFVQGMGLYTTEELKYSPKGKLRSQGTNDYKIPTVTEIPEEFHVTLVHSRNPVAIYSSKVSMGVLIHVQGYVSATFVAAGTKSLQP